jgi:hypothetical protein
MRSLRHGLRHEQMIEGIAVMKRKSSKSDKMRIRDIQPIEPLPRQDRKDLFYIGIKFADPQFHGDFPKEDSADEDVVLGIADKATRVVPQLIVVQSPQQCMRIEQQPHVPSSMDVRTSAGRLSKSSASLIFPRNAPGLRSTTSEDGGPISATTL